MSLKIPLGVLKHLGGEVPEAYVHQEAGAALCPPPAPQFRQPDGSLGVGSPENPYDWSTDFVKWMLR